MPVNPNQSSNLAKVSRFNRNLGRSPRFRGLIEAFEDSDGKIRFRSLFDGEIRDDIISMAGHVEASGINTYRIFSSDPTENLGGVKGLQQIAEEQRVINESLQNLTPAQRAALQRMGLGDAIGQNSISIQYLKYDLGKKDKAKKLDEILKASSPENAGLLNITDDSVTVLNYTVGKKTLTDKEVMRLKYFLGIGTLTDKFVDKILGKPGSELDFSPMAKLTKRMQSMISERDVALSGKFFTETLGLDSSVAAGKMDFANSKVYKFDDVSAFIRAMLGGSTTEAERFLLTAGLEIEQTAQGIQDIVKEAKGPGVLRDALEKMFVQTSLDEGDDARKLLGFMQSQFAAANQSFEQFETSLKTIAGSTKNLDEAQMANKVLAGLRGIEQMRDGEFIGDVKILGEFIKDFEEQKKNIIDKARNAGLKLTPDEVGEIRDLDSMIESLRVAQKNGFKDMDSIIARLQLPGMQGKGEMFLRFLEKYKSVMPKELEDKLLILPQSAIKQEVQGVPSLLLNIAKKHADNVYMDPLMAMYHPDYFGTPEFMESVGKHSEKQLQAIDDFMKSGTLDPSVEKKLLDQIKKQAMDNALLPDMNAAARSAYVRNRAMAKEILSMMQRNSDPRTIPEYVRMVTDFYTQNAFRVKGERVDLVMPDAARAALRTQQSSGPMFESAIDLHSKVMIDINNIKDGTLVGMDDKVAVQDRLVKAGLLRNQSEAELNFLKFRFTEGGNRMVFNGAAAHIYHHSLGTFDLDDKGVPIMTTFKDSKGNDRLAFMTMRQPTGFKEKIFMQADLTHEHTLKNILSLGSSDWEGLLNDVGAAYELKSNLARGGSPMAQSKIDEILDVLRQARGNSKNLNFKNITSEQIEMVLAGLRQTSRAQDEYGFNKIMNITDRDLLEMTAKGSASPLGINQRVAAVGGFDTLRNSLARRGIKVDSMPQYSTGNFVTLLTEESGRANQDALMKALFEETGKQFSTPDELRAYQDSLMGTKEDLFKRKVLKDSDEFIRFMEEYSPYMTAVERATRATQIEAGELLGGALGTYINRQSSAVYMSDQVINAIATLEQKGVSSVSATVGAKSGVFDLAEFFYSQYAIGIIPPSSAVDIDKAVAAKMVAQQEEMQKLAMAIDVMRQSNKNISEEAVLKVLGQIGDIGDLTLEEVGQQTVKTMGKQIGFLRAKQIAAGVNADDLIGVDMTMFGDSPYARVKGRDVGLTLQGVLSGAEEALATAQTQAERTAIQTFIDGFSAMSASAQLSSLALGETSEFRTVGRLAEKSQKIRELFEGKASLAQKSARNANTTYEAVEQARYVNQVDAVIESQRANIEAIVSLARERSEASKAGRSISDLKFLSDNLTDETSSMFYQAIATIRQTSPDSNILDIYDTLQARLTATFGQRSLKALEGVVDISGREDLMTEMLDLKDQSFARQTARTNVRNLSFEGYQEVLDEIKAAGINTDTINLDDPEIRQLLDNVVEKRKQRKRVDNLQKTIQARRGEIDAIQQKMDAVPGYDSTVTKLQRQIDKKGTKLVNAEARLLSAQQAYGAVAGVNDTDSLYDFAQATRKGMSLIPGKNPSASPRIEEAALRASSESVLRRMEDTMDATQSVQAFETIDETEIDDSILRTLAEADQASIDPVESATRYTRFKDRAKSPAIMDVLQDKTIRRSAYAVAGLVAFGLIYSKVKERGQDEMTGPPLLPGGSAYESDYPRDLPSISDLKYLNPTTLGMQYKINTFGSEEQLGKLQELVGSVVDGPIDSTIYNGLPTLGRDPYNNIASSF